MQELQRYTDLIPGSGKSPGEGNGNPFHSSCLGNPKDREAWQAAVLGGHKKWDTTEHLSTHTLAPTEPGVQELGKKKTTNEEMRLGISELVYSAFPSPLHVAHVSCVICSLFLLHQM